MVKAHPEMRRFACGIVVKQLPAVAAIKAAYDVDLDGGFLLWKPIPDAPRWNALSAGTPAGVSGTGYASVKISGIRYMVHRLLWKVYTGHDPRGVIDHINGVRDDNRICNLRDVSPSVNSMNAVRGRWSTELAERAAIDKAHRQARIEARERELLARLKAKYEEATA